MLSIISVLQKERYLYKPKLPQVLTKNIDQISIQKGASTESIAFQSEMKQAFEETYGMPVVSFREGKNPQENKKLTVGVILSGGQAPGGHNVIAGLFDGLKKGNPESRLFGFLGGPSGIIEDKAIELTPAFIDQFRNTGGFDIIGSGRTKLETEEQFNKALSVCRKRGIDAVVIIGGDDSNTNAAILAEYFKKKKEPVSVIGVPKTIDGDLKNEHIETSFGFDTATKTFSELIGNIERDANSAKKYWHFVKLMGRSASHITLECALQCHPNMAIISEEIKENQKTLNQLIDDLCEVVVNRSRNKENFGVVLVPEGLIEFIPEVGRLIEELNTLLAVNNTYFSSLHTFEDQAEWINRKLSKDSSYVFSTMPNNIQRQLLMDRDPHGNVQVSRIETEKLLIEMTETRLNELKAEGKYTGKFTTQHHFLGYEGRCAFPSNFDADYCYSLGFNAFMLISAGLTGYISSIKNLAKPAGEWVAGGIPLTMMMTMEQRHGKLKPVIQKAMTDLQGKPFMSFVNNRDEWAVKTSYTYPGAIQYYGPDSVCNQPSITIRLEHNAV
ncbi:MAG: diphosphate--fructose-6-phosphate 1-phosphotransferase [Spirochaetales bacterium]|nr:MAG: diphosphate--fructose-6-phosphate 1-phosphotransferase [Spirochaetales bacterium]